MHQNLPADSNTNSYHNEWLSEIRFCVCVCHLSVCVVCVFTLCVTVCVIKSLKTILLYPAVLYIIFSCWKPVSVDRPIHSTCPSMGLCLWTPLPAPSLPSHAGLRPLVSSHILSSNTGLCLPSLHPHHSWFHDSQSLFPSFHSLSEREQIFVFSMLWWNKL